MKEYEKLLFEDTKRREYQKAIEEINLGLFEQKQEQTFDYTGYTLMTYNNKKYKGKYDLYQNDETMELVFVCPLVENNKGDEDERKDLAPYSYDVLYLEYLDAETWEEVKKASVHEKALMIDTFYIASIVCYFVYAVFTVFSIIVLYISFRRFSDVLFFSGALIAGWMIATILMPLLLIKYRKFKAD